MEQNADRADEPCLKLLPFFGIPQTSSIVTETGIFRIPPFFVCVTASKEGIMSEGRRSMGREIVLGIGDGMSSSKRQTDTKERVRFDLFFAADSS